MQDCLLTYYAEYPLEQPDTLFTLCWKIVDTTQEVDHLAASFNAFKQTWTSPFQEMSLYVCGRSALPQDESASKRSEVAAISAVPEAVRFLHIVGRHHYRDWNKACGIREAH